MTATVPVESSGLVELRYRYGPQLLPAGGDPTSMWRYRALLPLDDQPIRYSLPVGGTPLLALPGLRRASKLPNLWIKDETRSPTCSNKDRATALSCELALREEKIAITAASTGNVAVSLAIGAAAAGLEAMIFVAAGVGEGKLRLMLQAGARVFKVEEGYEAAFRLSRKAAAKFGWYDRNTGVNPATLEAKKTVALEIWEQLGRAVPDVVVVPAGDGTTLSALAKGFRELVLCRATDHLPRLIGVQAEGCQPLKRTWEGKRCGPIRGTCADGIYVASPSNAATAVRDVKESHGAFVAVSDEAILAAMDELASRGGVLAEPAAAASYAGLLVARDAGLIDPSEIVVAEITGSALKTPHLLPCQAGSVHTIRATLAEIERVL
ncbi:MAG TPA: pyridoxal-phosphate dependent enzyme [Chloroflexota bacterium]|nr:pyridoxal-phosphate dependent enzyme [Chloroflexota bacterium]